MPNFPTSPQCFANHLGLWLMDPTWLREALAHIQAGTWQAVSRPKAQDPEEAMIVGDGVAVLNNCLTEFQLMFCSFAPRSRLSYGFLSPYPPPPPRSSRRSSRRS